MIKYFRRLKRFKNRVTPLDKVFLRFSTDYKIMVMRQRNITRATIVAILSVIEDKLDTVELAIITSNAHGDMGLDFEAEIAVGQVQRKVSVVIKFRTYGNIPHYQIEARFDNPAPGCNVQDYLEKRLKLPASDYNRRIDYARQHDGVVSVHFQYLPGRSILKRLKKLLSFGDTNDRCPR